ncbi:unnamed protein product [Scytosiphon promiscuus]
MSELAADESSSPHTGADLLDCSRYGELEDVEAILSSGVDANHKDAHGNTALHLSCANGHAEVIKALIKAGASHLPNGAGNRPLQWAVQNKHDECVRTLMEMYPESSQMNVLDKNGFGKSALTDAFRTGDAEMVKMVLNHKSAEEDILLQQSSLSKGKKKGNKGVSSKPINKRKGGSGGGDEADEDGGDDGDDEDGPSITHELGFGIGESVPEEAGSPGSGADSGSGGGGSAEEDEEDDDEAKRKKKRGKRFLVRELPIRNPDECFGDDAREDTTGLNLWAAAVVLARWVASPAVTSRLEGKTVLELGAGCGAGGISAAVHGKPASVLITDLNAETMANLGHNIELNRERYPAGSEVRAVTLDWGDESTWEQAAPPVDVILAADVVYQAHETSPLLHAILSLLKPGGSFFHVAPVTERDGLKGFLARLCGTSTSTTSTAEGAGGVDGAGNAGDNNNCSGFELVSATDAPPEFTQNPLISGSEDEYMVHFNELPSATFRLHEFRKR